ncbi:hypothetical protein B0T20DRAFT_391306 [Sordaria brevicollis]|uniref:Uncharacterized protein n=1 Tax=Sordaria brevicollis TaxID=83679 RepID=A0AAE0PGY5_SORBR|nr:hypothetical protein B0T20DRAFT_391306 [Sordaria brevicollis]
MEETVFREAGLDLTAMSTSSSIKIWDMQIWSVFQIRFGKPQTKGETAFGSLGALGNVSILHNATNDCVAQMLSLLKLLHISDEEWKAWFGTQRVDLPPMSMDCVDPAIYRHNFASRPRSLRGPAMPQGNCQRTSGVQHFALPPSTGPTTSGSTGVNVATPTQTTTLK